MDPINVLNGIPFNVLNGIPFNVLNGMPINVLNGIQFIIGGDGQLIHVNFHNPQFLNWLYRDSLTTGRKSPVSCFAPIKQKNPNVISNVISNGIKIPFHLPKIDESKISKVGESKISKIDEPKISKVGKSKVGKSKVGKSKVGKSKVGKSKVGK